MSWETKSLSEVVELRRGFDLPHAHRVEGNIPVLSAGTTSGLHNEYKVEGPGFVVGRATNLGVPTWSDGPYWPLNTTLYAADFKGNDPRFLFRLFQTIDFTGFDSGSVQPMLNRNYIAKVQVRVPDLGTQRAIAEVLGALDDKIVANERAAKKLDALIDALVYQIVAQGKRMMVGDILTLNYGKSLPAKLRNPGDIPVVGSGGISGYHDTYLVKNSGTVIGRKGTVGATYWVNGPHYPIDTAYFVESSLPYSNELLYRLVKTVDFTGLNSDSAVPGLNRDEAYSQPIMIPSSEQIGTISNLAASFQASISAVDGESAALAKTRDELLPLLMSGKITVKDAEAIASDAI